MLLNRILQTHKECFACTFSNSWTAHYNKNFFEHFGCLTQCLYSLMFKYQTAWLLMEILISVEHSGCSKCLQFFARLFVSTENRKFNVAIAERVHGAEVVRSCEQSSSMTFFRQCWLMEPKQKGIMALFNHSTVKVELKKNHYCVCNEKRRWFRDNLQNRCCTKYSSIYLSYYWIFWLP